MTALQSDPVVKPAPAPRQLGREATVLHGHVPETSVLGEVSQSSGQVIDSPSLKTRRTKTIAREPCSFCLNLVSVGPE